MSETIRKAQEKLQDALKTETQHCMHIMVLQHLLKKVAQDEAFAELVNLEYKSWTRCKQFFYQDAYDRMAMCLKDGKISSDDTVKLPSGTVGYGDHLSDDVTYRAAEFYFSVDDKEEWEKEQKEKQRKAAEDEKKKAKNKVSTAESSVKLKKSLLKSAQEKFDKAPDDDKLKESLEKAKAELEKAEAELSHENEVFNKAYPNEKDEKSVKSKKATSVKTVEKAEPKYETVTVSKEVADYSNATAYIRFADATAYSTQAEKLNTYLNSIPGETTTYAYLNATKGGKLLGKVAFSDEVVDTLKKMFGDTAVYIKDVTTKTIEVEEKRLVDEAAVVEIEGQMSLEQFISA